ncbi:MAG TPA: UbiA family prenyltransferase [Caulobacteraceae bacterium]
MGADDGFLASTAAGKVPLVVDLDGALLATDVLVESLTAFVFRNPANLFTACGWLLHGRATLKRKVAEACPLDVTSLPFRDDVLAYARAEAADGREVYVATAADQRLAEAVVEPLDFIKGVQGSDGVVNFKGRRKAEALAERFPGGFAYVGDAAPDLEVWKVATDCVFAGSSPGVARQLDRMGAQVTLLPPRRAGLGDWIKLLRLHQWAKNGLIFLPLMLGGALFSGAAWVNCVLGFLALGLIASGTYVFNDLVDLQSDRRHWSKKKRAFASGLVPIPVGLALAPACVIAGLGLGALTGQWALLALLGGYLVTTVSYSLAIKQTPILDAMTLAGLFTLRLAIGVVCAAVLWSPWLLVFSMFIFSSLSLAKRSTELGRMAAAGLERMPGRGYVKADAPLVFALGVSLSTAATFVLVMYLIQDAFRAEFYRFPGALWAMPVVIALWTGRIWLLCGRQELNDDPVLFAVKDKVSLLLGAIGALGVVSAVFL